MASNKWTKANRLTEVIKHEVRIEKVGEPLGFSRESLAPYGDAFEHMSDGEKIYTVWMTTRTGLDREVISCTVFLTEEEALHAIRSRPVGTITGDGFGFPLRFKEMICKVRGPFQSQELLSKLFLMQDEEAVHFKCYEALLKAGVINEKNYDISQQVLDWLGEVHVQWMKKEYGENWSCVGELEYCLNHFPDSSLATLAAKLFFAQFVSYDDFSAGYYTKEIEAIAGGTEGAALSTTETRKKAGRAGGQASRERRLANLEIMMQEIEALSRVVGIISEERILQQARESASRRCDTMPKSKSTLADYETALRSEEPFRSRYESVFRKNA
ncbi:hypothetical protein [Pseudooceanicola sp.]|uniref:hypothetical protein n=1 Tax=Pseudooceanicola sp. TaxID=1914328 RepID=UPI0040581AED